MESTPPQIPADQTQAPPSPKAEAVALAGLILQGLVFLLTCLVLLYTRNTARGLPGVGSLAGEAQHLLPGVVLWLLCYLRLRLGRLAWEEDRDLEKLRTRGEASSSLFEASQKPDAYTAKGRLHKLERWFVPSVTVLVALGMIGGCVTTLISYRFHTEFDPGQLTRSAAFLVAFAFAAFVFSQYVVGLSRDPAHRNLRPAGAYLLSNSFFLLLCAVSLALLSAEVVLLERVLAILLRVLVGLLGLEFIINFVLDFFRPRLPGQELRPSYDSRILGIFAQPGSIWTAVADALDYQFGFRVSKTWFFSFIGRMVLPLVAFQLIFALLLTCLVIVDSGETRIVERFGRRQRTLEPGLHLKLPWPVERTHSLPTGRVQRIIVGTQHASEESEHTEELVHLWTGIPKDEHGHSHGDDHADEGPIEYILVASRETPRAGDPPPQAGGEGEPSAGGAAAPLEEAGSPLAPEPAVRKQSVPVSVIAASVVVHYRILDPLTYFYGYSDPEHTLRRVAFRELVQLASSVDLHDLMGPQRMVLGKRLLKQMEEPARGLGVKLLHLEFMDIHPAMPVAESFEKMISAEEQRKTLIVEAQRDAELTVRNAGAKAQATVHEAAAYRFRRKQLSQAAIESFAHHEKAFEAAPELYRSRRYLSTLKDVLKGKRLIFVPAGVAQEETVINLKQALKADFLDIDLEE